MASFFEALWESIFTPGTTPTLLIATNASFAALQLLLLTLLVATYSIHFFFLSILCGGLWASINWFARELALEKNKAAERDRLAKGKSPDAAHDSDTETETVPDQSTKDDSIQAISSSSSAHAQPDPPVSADMLRRRRSLGDSSGYVSTDSEWEKIGGS